MSCRTEQVGTRGNASDLFSKGSLFESRSKRQLSWMKFFVVSLVPPDEGWDSTITSFYRPFLVLILYIAIRRCVALVKASLNKQTAYRINLYLCKSPLTKQLRSSENGFTNIRNLSGVRISAEAPAILTEGFCYFLSIPAAVKITLAQYLVLTKRR